MGLKKIFESLLFVILLGILVFVWYRVPVPCSVPLQYSLGQFDPRFNISPEAFLKDIALGEKPWEGAEEKELFAYNPEAPFKINLVYDERQARTQEQLQIEASRSALEKKQAGIVETQAKLKASYESAKTDYEKTLASFQNNLSSYNARAEYWTSVGGAPPEEYQKLQSERKKLERTQSDLEAQRKNINILAGKINSTSKTAVATVNEYNSQVKNFLERHADEHEDFDEGLYKGTEIDIYEFPNEAHLRAVLAHELGHAIGLDHVGNPGSIMYPMMGGQDTEHLALTSEDTSELSRVCSQGRLDLFKMKLTLLREKLSMLYLSQ